MKKYCMLATVLVLTLSVFTGCGCRKQVPETRPTTEATIMPTVATTEHPTAATTEHPTTATEHTVIPDGTDNNATEGTTHNNATDNTAATGENNARNRAARVK